MAERPRAIVNLSILVAISFVLVGLVLYVFYFNPDHVVLRLGRSASFSAPLAIILISMFGIGFLCCAVFGLYLGMKSYFRERRLQNLHRRWEKNLDNMVRARSFLSSHEWDSAREEWKAIVRRDPSDIIGRIELSRSLEGSGNAQEALKVLDAARAYDPHNVEVLFRAAELNLVLNNRTAAIDNIALILQHRPSPRAARMARDISEELGLIEQALSYQSKLEELEGDEEKAIRARLEMKQILAAHPEHSTEIRDELRKLSKRYPDFVPAVTELARVEYALGQNEEASKLLLKASKISGETKYWITAASAWIKKSEPERAIAVGKSGNSQLSGKNRVHSELELIKLFLTLNMNEEAKKALSDFPALLASQKVEADRDLSRTALILKGRCYNALGEYKEASRIWQQLSDAQYDLEAIPLNGGHATQAFTPEPRLSTP